MSLNSKKSEREISDRMRTLQHVPVADSIAIIFGEEGAQKVANISFDGISDAAELFALLTKIMWQGLKYVKHVPADRELDLESLSRQDLDHVKYCMFRAGVEVNMEIMPVKEVTHDYLSDPANEPVKHLVTDGDAGRLENHALVIGTQHYRIIVGFHCVVRGEDDFE